MFIPLSIEGNKMGPLKATFSKNITQFLPKNNEQELGLLIISILFERKIWRKFFLYWGNSQISSSWFPKVLLGKSRSNVYVTICCCFFPFLLGTFVKFRKVTLSLVMSLCLFAWKNSAPTGQILMKFDIWVFFEKSVEKNDVFFKKSEKNNNGYLTWWRVYIYDNISPNYF